MRTHFLPTASIALAAFALVTAGCGQTAPSAPTASSSSAAVEPEGRVEQASANLPEDAPGAVRVASAEAEVAPADEQSTPKPKAAPEQPPAQAAAPLPLDDPQAADVVMPLVVLSAAHAKTCTIRIGDPFPSMTLASLDGQQTSLDKLKGQKLTVVVFWNGKRRSALEELTDLTPDILSRYGANGVAVVGINVGDDPQVARELAEQAGAKFVNLCDPDGSSFKEVATAYLPRTYLLDSNGKVAWFDLEYSRTTRRELSQAIRYVLLHP